MGTPTWISLLCFGLGGFTPALILFGWDVASGVTTGLALGYSGTLSCMTPSTGGSSSMVRYCTEPRCTTHFTTMEGRGNYGVSSPFWDYIFGTYIAPAPRRSITAVGERAVFHFEPRVRCGPRGNKVGNAIGTIAWSANYFVFIEFIWLLRMEDSMRVLIAATLFATALASSVHSRRALTLITSGA